LPVNLGAISCTSDFGKTIGWKIQEGRDFSKDLATDSTALIINESAAKFMGFKNAVGQKIRWRKTDFTVIGVVKDLIMDSPFDPVKPTVFSLNLAQTNAIFKINFITIKLAPNANLRDALSKVEEVFKKYNPESPFEFKFNDQEYEAKFRAEQRISKLGSVFAMLAIFISCLGIFGLSSFMAVQRTKEIGVRKVLGATKFGLWRLFTSDFVLLIIVAL
jgi:putative ABC transport system permease protein